MSQIEIGNTIRAVHQALGYDPDALRRLGKTLTDEFLAPALAERAAIEARNRAAFEAVRAATPRVNLAAAIANGNFRR
jgi:hypothetical protein